MIEEYDYSITLKNVSDSQLNWGWGWRGDSRLEIGQLVILHFFDNLTDLFTQVFNSVMAQLWRYREAACAVLTLSLVVYGMLLLTKIFAWIKVVLIASVIGGVLLRYEYVSLLIPLWFISILSGTFLELMFTT